MVIYLVENTVQHLNKKGQILQSNIITFIHQSLTVHNMRYQVVPIVKAHLSDMHAYADDTQLFLSFKLDSHTNQAEAVGALEE